MNINPQYAYLIGNAFFLIVWLILFMLRKDLRKEMLLMSVLIAPLGPLSELFYLRDYWQPQIFTGWVIGIEDLLFAFSIGGIAGVAYEVFFGKRYAKRHLHKRSYFMLGIVVFGVLWMIFGNLVLGFNSIYVSTAGFLLIGLAMLVVRHDLLRDALISGLLVGVLMFIFYLLFIPLHTGIIQEWWLLDNLSGVLIFGVPLEELMWGFGWGFVAGPVYEFINGLRLKRALK